MVVNQLYTPQIIAQAKQQFNSSQPQFILLGSLFTESVVAELQANAKKLAYDVEHEILRHSFEVAQLNDVMHHIVTDPKLLETVSQFASQPIQWRVVKLSWKSYKMLSDTEEQSLGEDFIIDISSEWDDACGGSVIYTYDDDFLDVGFNGAGSCFIVRRSKGMQRFFKYVNHYARGKERVLLVGTTCKPQ